MSQRKRQQRRLSNDENDGQKKDSYTMATITPAIIDSSAIPTLDLHGFFLEPAIQNLVVFLEKHCSQENNKATSTSYTTTCNSVTSPRFHSYKKSSLVQVITGTGSHSSTTGGPVLKDAVDSFLRRHSFQYKYFTRGGYFILPTINTGSLTYRSKSCSVDTKIVTISPATSNGDDRTSLLRLQKNSTGLKSLQQSPTSNVCTNTTSYDVADMPTLQEVVRDESELRRGIDESIEEYRVRQKEHNEEQKICRRIVQLSQEELEKEEKQEKLLMLRVIQESIELSERECDEDDSALKEAIAESLEESERFADNEDGFDFLLLQRVLQESEALKETVERECDEDDSALKEAIAESLEESERTTDNEDDFDFLLLQRVLQESEALKKTVERELEEMFSNDYDGP
jgi:hypothetical protein